VSVTRGTFDEDALGVGVAGALAAGDGVGDGVGDVATVDGAPHAMAATAAIKRRDDCMNDPEG